jgi:predicted DNA-binding protein
MTTQMIIRIDPDLKNRFSRLAKVKGKTTSQMVRELIEEYIREKDLATHVDDLWDRIGGELSSKGTKQGDINRAIKESRRGRR